MQQLPVEDVLVRSSAIATAASDSPFVEVRSCNRMSGVRPSAVCSTSSACRPDAVLSGVFLTDLRHSGRSLCWWANLPIAERLRHERGSWCQKRKMRKPVR
jgi:hypothetical protein